MTSLCSVICYQSFVTSRCLRSHQILSTRKQITDKNDVVTSQAMTVIFDAAKPPPPQKKKTFLKKIVYALLQG